MFHYLNMIFISEFTVCFISYFIRHGFKQKQIVRFMSADLDGRFDLAKERLNKLEKDPGNEVKLKIYALFKQVSTILSNGVCGCILSYQITSVYSVYSYLHLLVLVSSCILNCLFCQETMVNVHAYRMLLKIFIGYQSVVLSIHWKVEIPSYMVESSQCHHCSFSSKDSLHRL